MNDSPPFEWLAVQPYEPIWQRLNQQATAIAAGERQEIVWACEHEPVYTTGRRAVDNRKEDRLPAPLIQTDRGGETTFHGTGQLMLYPCINLRQRGLSPRDYVHLLEESCIGLLLDHHVEAARICGLPGVWVDERKVAAIGLRIQNGVAYHGMALNIGVDPHWFESINPCGTGKAIVNLSDLTKRVPPMKVLAQQWHAKLALLLDRN